MDQHQQEKNKINPAERDLINEKSREAQKPKKKLILVFGSFNPPTKAHVEMACVLYTTYWDCEICFVPSNLNDTQEWGEVEYPIPLSERIRLLDMVLPGGIDVWDTGEASEMGKTYNVVDAAKNLGVYSEVLICLGIDNLREIENWYEGKKLIEENKFIIFDRLGVEPEEYDELLAKLKPGSYKILNPPHSTVSSSQIREKYLSETEAVEDILDDVLPEVYVYMQMNPGLWQEPREAEEETREAAQMNPYLWQEPPAEVLDESGEIVGETRGACEARDENGEIIANLPVETEESGEAREPT